MNSLPGDPSLPPGCRLADIDPPARRRDEDAEEADEAEVPHGISMTQEQVAALEAEAQRLWEEIKPFEEVYQAKVKEWSYANDKAKDARLELVIHKRIEDRLAAERRAE